jgi:hypothetical protein
LGICRSHKHTPTQTLPNETFCYLTCYSLPNEGAEASIQAEVLYLNIHRGNTERNTHKKNGSVFHQPFFVPGVTILLSLSVFSLMIADALPQTSEAIPLLGQPLCSWNEKLNKCPPVLCLRFFLLCLSSSLASFACCLGPVVNMNVGMSVKVYSSLDSVRALRFSNLLTLLFTHCRHKYIVAEPIYSMESEIMFPYILLSMLLEAFSHICRS